jgi:dTDP-4-dehydrorhamnose 3,5-epimerase-like enzyme
MTTENERFTAAVAEGRYDDDPAVPLDNDFVNEKGVIRNLVLGPIGGAAFLRSVKGSVRANHYHKTDWHYAFIVSGAVQYFWRPIGSSEKPKTKIFRVGQMIFTPPMLEHAFLALEDTTFVTLSRLARTEETHEGDVVRLAESLV